MKWQQISRLHQYHKAAPRPLCSRGRQSRAPFRFGKNCSSRRSMTISKQSGCLEPLHHQSPWLVFFAAVSPAAVASENGIHFQSECGHIAARSRYVHVMLSDDNLADADDTLELLRSLTQDQSLGSHSRTALRLAEEAARVLTPEVSELLVLCAKGLTEPG